MKVKALRSFGGQYAMFKGEVAELPENDVTAILVDEGCIVETEEEPAGPEAVEEVEEQEESEAVEEVEGQEAEEAAAVDLATLSKDELLEYAEQQGIEVNKKLRKEDLLKAIKGE